VQIKDDFCGMDVNTPLGGSMPIEAAPVLSYNNELLTSVAATSTHDYTVVFLGTVNGHLKKAVVESSLSAFEFSDIVIEEGSLVNPDMYLMDLNNKNYLYVMTTRRVTLVKVQECQIYRTCTECLGARDPYCGWCSLENKCSLRSNCAEAAHDPLYWLSYKSGKCTTITHVHPPQIQRTTARTLILVIDNLPVLEGQFFCAFTTAAKTQITNATRSANGVSCPTPPTDSLPPISPGQHHFTAKLSVRMKDSPDFVATNFTFYDCGSYSSCTQCVSSPFPCDWCVGGHRCTHDTGENCRNDILVTGVSSVGPSIRSGPGFCPRINATAGGTTEGKIY
jgi:plexin A